MSAAGSLPTLAAREAQEHGANKQRDAFKTGVHGAHTLNKNIRMQAPWKPSRRLGSVRCDRTGTRAIDEYLRLGVGALRRTAQQENGSWD